MDCTMLKLILNTLDSIEIKGKSNIDKMLGCMNALECIIKQSESKDEEEVVDNG